MPKMRRFSNRTHLAFVAVGVAGLLLVISLLFFANTSAQLQTGVLRLRVRVKQGDKTQGLSRKRFYLIKGTLEQNKALLETIEKQTVVTVGCFYSKLGASQGLIDWLKAGDCESVYCREVEQEFIVGPKAIPEFARGYAAGEKEFGPGEAGRKWLSNNLDAQLRDGFYKQRRRELELLTKQAETTSGSGILSVMTDRNGTAYFTDLSPGTYVLSSLLPMELTQTSVNWNCEVQVKPGDIATEKPYLVSNAKDRNVKCVAIEKPLPTCDK